MKLYKCDCDWTETENKAGGGVKGYVLTKECDECKAKREADNIATKLKEAERKAVADREALIQTKMREIAEAELKKEGKLD